MSHQQSVSDIDRIIAKHGDPDGRLRRLKEHISSQPPHPGKAKPKIQGDLLVISPAKQAPSYVLKSGFQQRIQR